MQARLAVGDPDGLAAGSDEVEPNGALKSPPPPFPEVDRGAKGNPFIGLRPGFDARRLNGALARAGLDGLTPGRAGSAIRATAISIPATA